MASSASSPDMLVTLKVHYDGTNRRFKFPLRDLGASNLEDKLRAILMIPAGKEAVFERYSDSAASYVVLDRSNHSVYKQLYRAAKAKNKLKLRVTTLALEIVEEQKIVPKPVTVEDESEFPELNVTKSESGIADNANITAPPPVSEPAKSTNEPDPRHALLDEIQQRAAERTRAAENAIRDLVNNIHEPVSGLDARGGANTTSGSQTSVEIPVTYGSDHVTLPIHSCGEPMCARPSFAVCCNNCGITVPDAHYHCSTCDDGDFDLCQGCVDLGISCNSSDHWLIKRFVRNGAIINSTTERIAPKPKAPRAQETLVVPARTLVPSSARTVPVPIMADRTYGAIRTCNSCIQEFRDPHFLQCTACDDFDLCKNCFVKDCHGHNPKHEFVPAVAGTTFDTDVTRRLTAGRNKMHNAICDGCDKYITGVRNKCLQCPDWDYCADCFKSASFIHPNHRFVPFYEPVETYNRVTRPTHFGICCDGPLCANGRSASAYIVGDRYKCAVCNDLDFCANCEANPSNLHNKTHPLIKFKTPVRHVSVTTTGEREDGRRMPAMGDHTNSPAPQATSPDPVIAASCVKTLIDLSPDDDVEDVKIEEAKETKVEQVEQVEEKPVSEVAAAPSLEDLVATFERDTVADGTVMPPNHVFEQTWVLRNDGPIAWPAGCAVKFVGGDYMGHVDSNHPAGIHELVSASQSTVCYEPLEVGQEFPFTVLLRTPAREGKYISYWRLTTEDGHKFGHRLWCDVSVQVPKVKVEEADSEEIPENLQEETLEEVSEEIPDDGSEATHESQMIFPKLEKESPVASMHEDPESETSLTHETEPAEVDDFEDCAEVDEWAEDQSADGFLTDEEYDILDASDEEYLEEQQKKMLRK